MYRITAILFCLSLWQVTVAQQDASIESFTLQEAIIYASKNHPSMDNAKMEVASAKARVKEVRAVGLPQVSGTVNFQHFLKQQATLLDPTAFGPPDTSMVEQEPELQEVVFGTKNNLNASLDVNQLIFDGSYLVGIEAAELYVELAEKQIRSSVIDIKDNVTKAYFLVLISQANAILIDQNIQNVDRLLYETTQLYENGFVEEIEVDRLTLSLSNLASQAGSAERQIEMSTSLLKFHMGYPVEDPILLTDSLETFVGLAVENVDPDIAPKQRIELDLLDMQMDLKELEVKSIKKQYLPSLAAFGSLATSFQSDKFDLFEDKWLPFSLVGLRLSVPIFDGFQKRSQIQQREIEMIKFRNNKRQLEQSIALELAQARIDYQNATEQVNTQKASLELAEKIYNVSTIKYKEGMGSSLEVSSAEAQLYQTQGQYVKSLYDLIVARSSLERALGNL